MPYLSVSALVIHYEEALYQVYAPLPLPLRPIWSFFFKETDEIAKKLIALGLRRLRECGWLPDGQKF